MGIKSLLSKPFAAYIARKTRRWAESPKASQEGWMKKLVREAKETSFGKDHNFNEIRTYEDFKKNVPIRDYEELKPYIEKILEGEQNVLWKGKPLYLSKTSGTTSGVKYIPITHDSIHNHIDSARNALLAYIHETGNASFLDEKLIF